MLFYIDSAPWTVTRNHNVDVDSAPWTAATRYSIRRGFRTMDSSKSYCTLSDEDSAPRTAIKTTTNRSDSAPWTVTRNYNVDVGSAPWTAARGTVLYIVVKGFSTTDSDQKLQQTQKAIQHYGQQTETTTLNTEVDSAPWRAASKLLKCKL